jgi:hypothetical protein
MSSVGLPNTRWAESSNTLQGGTICLLARNLLLNSTARVVGRRLLWEIGAFEMSVINAIFFASFILFFLSVVGLVFWRLIARILTTAGEPGERRATERRRTDETSRRWHFLDNEGRAGQRLNPELPEPDRR